VAGHADSTATELAEHAQHMLDVEDAPAVTKAEWAAAGDDTLAVRTAAFDTAAIGLLRADPQLDYDRDLRVNELWWDRLMRRLGEWLGQAFGTKAGGLLLNNLHWGILATAVLFLLFFLRKRLFGQVLGAEPKTAKQVQELPADPAGLDLDGLLAQAEGGEDWRGALRWHYLKALRRLVDEGRVEWQPKHTDRDYLRQLQDPELRARFGELSFLFHWAWFGAAPMDAESYRRMAPTFIAFHGQGPARA
jgi:hypothetical protein